MRLGIFSDIHANYEALSAVMEAYRDEKIDVFYCLGDTVGIIAPGSPAEDPGDIDAFAAALAKMGFKPKLAPNVRKRLGFLAGDDQARADDLMGMFADREVKGIFCLRARKFLLLSTSALRKSAKTGQVKTLPLF